MLKYSVPMLYSVLLSCYLSYLSYLSYQLLFHCPSEAFKLCRIVNNYLPCYDVAFKKLWKQNDEDFATLIAKRKFIGTILAISIKSLKDSSFCFSRQENSRFQFFPLPSYLSISTSSRRKTFKEDAFFWPFFDSSDDPLVLLRSSKCTY